MLGPGACESSVPKASLVCLRAACRLGSVGPKARASVKAVSASSYRSSTVSAAPCVAQQLFSDNSEEVARTSAGYLRRRPARLLTQLHGSVAGQAISQLRHTSPDPRLCGPLTCRRCALGQSGCISTALLASFSASWASAIGSRPYSASCSDTAAGMPLRIWHILRAQAGVQRMRQPTGSTGPQWLWSKPSIVTHGCAAMCL